MSRLIPLDPEIRHRQKVRRHRNHGVLLLGVFIVSILIAYVMVRWSGLWLVHQDECEHVPWMLVLEGQTADMERTDYAVAMLNENKVDSVILLGKRIFKNKNTVDFYLEDMFRQSFLDSSRLFVLRHDAHSTLEEVYAVVPALMQRGIDSVLLITRDAATRRALLLFDQLSPDSITFLVQGVQDSRFQASTWILAREGWKIWLKEWAALLLAYPESWLRSPVTLVEGKQYPLEQVAQSDVQDSALKVVLPVLPALDSMDSFSGDSLSDSMDSTERPDSTPSDSSYSSTDSLAP